MQTAMNLTFRFLVCRDGNAALQFLLHAVNCVRFCFWHCDFFVCVWNIPGTAERICAKFTQKTCLVPHSHEFEGQGHQGQKTAFFGPFSGLHAAYVWWNIFSLLFFFKFCSYLTGSLTQSYRWHYASIQCKKIRVTVTWTTTGYNSYAGLCSTVLAPQAWQMSRRRHAPTCDLSKTLKTMLTSCAYSTTRHVAPTDDLNTRPSLT